MKRVGRKSKTGEQGNRDAFCALIAGVPESAFQGHTEFTRLSPGRRLEWLSQAAQFYFESGADAKRTRDRISTLSINTRDRSDYRVNLERVLELGELSKALWIAARCGEAPAQSDEERERRFWQFIIQSRQGAGEDRR